MAKQLKIVLAATTFLLAQGFTAIAADAPIQWANNAQVANAANGAIYGAPFKTDRADFNSTTLSLRQSEDRNAKTASRLGITFPKALDLERMGFLVGANGKVTVILSNKTKASLGKLSITKTTNGSPNGPKSGTMDKNFVLSLQFYPMQKDKLPGFIDFKSMDDGSTVRGYFFAEKGKEGDGFY